MHLVGLLELIKYGSYIFSNTVSSLDVVHFIAACEDDHGVGCVIHGNVTVMALYVIILVLDRRSGRHEKTAKPGKKNVWQWRIINIPQNSEANKVKASNEICVCCTVVSLSVTDMSFSHE